MRLQRVRDGLSRISWTRVATSALLATGLIAAFAFGSETNAEQPAEKAAAGNDLVSRGEYLVTTMGCGDCHTPMIMGPQGPDWDNTRMLSGHPADQPVSAPPADADRGGLWLWAPYNTVFMSPMGTAYAINLTPDEDTGIGAWTEEIFIKTLRTGQHWGQSRPILPPMPWAWYRHLTDEDLRAMFAYLRSIPAVRNRVPDAVVNLPGGEG